MDTGTPESGPSDFWVAMRRQDRILKLEARVAELERPVMRARLELLEGECEPTDNAVEILSAALTKQEEA